MGNMIMEGEKFSKKSSKAWHFLEDSSSFACIFVLVFSASLHREGMWGEHMHTGHYGQHGDEQKSGEQAQVCTFLHTDANLETS